MYVCVCVYVCICVLYVVCMYECMNLCMYECMYVYMYVRMYICMYTCMYVYVHVSMYVCMYVCICKYVCMYVCMYAISEQKVECVRILRIGTHKSSSFCLISATKFKLLLSPFLENLIFDFSQFCRAEWQVNTQTWWRRFLKKWSTCEN